MALTGLQIQKLLPKTNCKECGSNTCLAFAMKLAAKKAELSLCPYASEEAKQVLGAASEPPVKCIELGADKTLRLGEETVLYRHEKTFVHRTAFAIAVCDSDSDQAIDTALAQIKEYSLVRVGETMIIDMVAVVQKGGDAKKFVALAEKVWKDTHRPLVVISDDTNALKRVAEIISGSHSVLCASSPQQAQQLVEAARQYEHALAVTAPDVDSLCNLTAAIKEKGFNNLLVRFQTHSLAERFQMNAIARRAAIKDNFRPLGYPSLHVLDTGDIFTQTVNTITEIAKYGGIVVLPDFNKAMLTSLFTLRQNIFTDPQKPIQVEPKVYPIGEPVPTSPVFLTTNFSLTYFIVSGEIENSGISAWLVVPECEGMSVLTAWAAGKFSGATVAKFVKQVGLEAQIESRQMTIPGYVAQISGELEEGLPGWKVLVGPQEAGDLESYIKAKGF